MKMEMEAKVMTEQEMYEEFARMDGALDEALRSFGFKAKDIESVVKAIPACTEKGLYHWDIEWDGGERIVTFWLDKGITAREIACVMMGVYYALGGE